MRFMESSNDDDRRQFGNMSRDLEMLLTVLGGLDVDLMIREWYGYPMRDYCQWNPRYDDGDNGGGSGSGFGAGLSHVPICSSAHSEVQ